MSEAAKEYEVTYNSQRDEFDFVAVEDDSNRQRDSFSLTRQRFMRQLRLAENDEGRIKVLAHVKPSRKNRIRGVQ